MTTISISAPIAATTTSATAIAPAPATPVRLEWNYALTASPLGPLLIAATGRGLVRVAFESEDHARVLESLSCALGRGPRGRPARFIDSACRQLEEYFGRRRQAISAPVDLSLSSPFQRRIQDHLHLIEYGRTANYPQLARLAGNPKTVLAVGAACEANPLPLVLPCHRVHRLDGTLGGYPGGVEAKAALIALESEVSAGRGHLLGAPLAVQPPSVA